MKHKIIALVVVLLTITSCKQKEDLNIKPKPSSAPKVKLGKVEKYELPNGLKVIMVENHKLPRVSMTLQIDNEPYLEGVKAGVSALMGRLLGTGTKNITKDDFITQKDFMGATLDFDSESVSAASLKKYFPDVVKLLADGIKNPVFTQSELDKQKALILESLKADAKNGKEITKRVQSVLLYGKQHPYGEFITEETIKNITLEDVKQYYNTFFKPNNAYLAIVGDFDPEETKKLIDTSLKDWQKGDIPVSKFEKPVNVDKTEIDFVDVPSSVQSNVVVVNNLDLKLGDKDYYAVMIANSILGGGMSGRLFKNLREDKAYTYGAYSSVDQDRYAASFRANASVRNSVTDSAVVQFKKELDSIRVSKVSEEELKITKAIYTGNFVTSVSKPEVAASFALNIAKYKLPEDYYENYLDKINSVTVEDVQEAAKKYFKADNARIIVVGKGADVIPNLQKVGYKINYYDSYANPTKAFETIAIPEGVTSETVVENYFKAIGGKDKVEKIKTIMMVAESNMQGTPIKIVSKLSYPNKSLTEMSASGQVMQKQVFNGIKGFMEMQGQKSELTSEEIEELKSASAPFSDFAYAKGTISGVENVNNEKAYVITFQNKKVYYSVESGLKLQEITTFKDPNTGQEGSVQVLYSGYKDLEGIKFPYTLTQVFGQGMQMTLAVKKYEFNKNVSDSDFN